MVGEVQTLAKCLTERGGERTDERADVCVSAVEARKGEERRHDLRMEDRHLFTIMVGEEETLAKFLLHSGGEGTERGGAEGCVTVLKRGKAQERVALWRDTYASSLESSKLSLFFRMVLREGHTDHKGECVCVCGSLL